MNEPLFQDYFSGMSIKDIESLYNISNPTLYNRLKAAGLPRRKRILKYPERDDNFLSKIKDATQAYFLGLICADGNIDKKGCKIRISLQESDRGVLDFFSKRILGKNGIKIRPPGKRSKSNSAWLTISSKEMCKDLYLRNVLPTKSLTCHPTVSDLSPSLFASFLLGLFDGDGAIFSPIRKGRRPFLDFSIAMSPSFAAEVAKRLAQDFNIHIPVFMKKCQNGTLAYIRTSNQGTIESLYRALYQSCPIFLNRKRQIFADFFDKNQDSQDEP